MSAYNKGDNMKVNQKTAVYNAITSVLAEADIHFEDGMNISELMTKELRAQVNQILFVGFRNGSIELDREFTDTELKGYVSGLQSNWIRKDSRFNGNTKYVAKNPGSRAHVGDSQLKAMTALLKTLTSPEDKAEVQAAIDARQEELAAAKPKVTIDYSKLPAHLAAKFNKQ
jgi:hypothetical protein